jgi:hypothetical protein
MPVEIADPQGLAWGMVLSEEAAGDDRDGTMVEEAPAETD